MLSILTGKAYDITNRDFQKDVAEYARFETAGGLKLVVGMVADTIRGNELAARAATQIAFQTMSESTETDIHALLTEAFVQAHRVVKVLAHQNDIQLATTLAIAAIVDNSRLYVASLGHSRVYLFQAESRQLLPLTLDHYFANIAVQEGQLTAEQAAEHPDAKILRKYVGTPTPIAPDMTIYGGSPTMEIAIQRGREGIELEAGDIILISSDGLTKPSRQGTPVITVDLIHRAIVNHTAQQAANDIVETARRQRPTDTISLVILQAVPEIMAVSKIPLPALIGTTLTVIFLVLGMFYVLVGSGPQEPAVVQLSNRELTAFVAQTIAAFTDTPTPSPTPTSTPTSTPEANRVAFNFLNEPGSSEPEPVFLVQQLSTGTEHRKININHGSGNIFFDGLVFAQPFSNLRFSTVEDTLIDIRMQRNSDIFVASNDFDAVLIELAQIAGVNIFAEQTCLAAYYISDHQVTVSCYTGDCSYQLSEEEARTTINAGEQVTISMVDLIVESVNPIPLIEAQRYQEIWERTLDAGLETCVSQFLPVTPTPTPTEIVVELPTVTPSNTPTLEPSNTPRASDPTNTPRPAPTNTPRPTRQTYP